MPEVAPVQPLVAVVVHLGAQCDAWRVGAVAESGEGTNAGDLVDVAYEEHVALFWGLRAG